MMLEHFYIFSITNFMAKKFTAMVMGVTIIFESIAEKLTISFALKSSRIIAFTHASNREIKYMRIS